MTSATEVFTARLDAQLEQLASTEARLDTGGLADLLRDAGTAGDLHALARDIRAAARPAVAPSGDEPDWRRLADVSTRAQRLHAEVFALLATQALREQGVGREIVDAAEALVDRLLLASRVREPVLLALAPDVESLDHVASVLRLRFPGTTVWDLPVVAHEVGHHVVRTLPTVNETTRGALPLRELVDRAAASGRFLDPRWPHELAADTFATFALGATYPVACLTLRADPATGAARTASHPPWPWRVAAMLAALRASGRAADDDGPVQMAQAVVRPLWHAIGGQDADDESAVVAEQLAQAVVDELVRHTVDLRYRGADRATALALRIDGPDRVDALSHETDAVTVVDAAWRWRRRNLGATPDARVRVESAVLARLGELGGPPR